MGDDVLVDERCCARAPPTFQFVDETGAVGLVLGIVINSPTTTSSLEIFFCPNY